MSGRSHAVVALAAIALLVALVVWGDFPPSATGPAPPLPTPGSATPDPNPQESSSSPSVPVPSSSAPSPTLDLPTLPTLLPGTTLTPCPRPGPPERLTVATFNIHFGLGGARQLRLEEIAGEIAAVDPDVVLLQEVDRFRARSSLVDEPAALAGLLGMSPAYAANVVVPSARIGDSDAEYGTAILTRLPVVGRAHGMLPNFPGHQPRGLQRLRVRVGERVVSIYNTHLDNLLPALRQLQLQHIREVVDGDRHPVILGGDFNATPGSPALEEVLGGPDATLRDPWPLVGAGEGLTAPVNVPRVRIDYLLADTRWQPRSAATWRSLVSDHRGLVVRFALPAARVCG